MPEATTEAKPKMTTIRVIRENETDNGKFLEDDLWGFRITGGSDFGMPITVFHVSIHIYIPTIFSFSNFFTCFYNQ